jgi:2-C-methyl-D-erythritol 4-phosphate cytidylyltransferase
MSGRATGRSGVAVVIAAAGGGHRMGAATNKIFLPVAGRPILARTLGLFERLAIVDTIVLVVAPADHPGCQAVVRDGAFVKVRRIVDGGANRHASEAAGVFALEDETRAGRIDTILVHDAVRPFVAAEQVEAVVAESRANGAAILAIPAVEPLIVVAEDGAVAAAGDDLWVAQTPQAFGAALLVDAHRRAAEDGFVGTDTSSVVERTGQAVSIVLGRPENIKITTPDDLLRAEFIATELSNGMPPPRLGSLTPRT